MTEAKDEKNTCFRNLSCDRAIGEVNLLENCEDGGRTMEKIFTVLFYWSLNFAINQIICLWLAARVSTINVSEVMGVTWSSGGSEISKLIWNAS